MRGARRDQAPCTSHRTSHFALRTSPRTRTAADVPVSTTMTAILLNLLLLAMIAYGYIQYMLAWVLVAVPIIVVTATYFRHWLKGSGR